MKKNESEAFKELREQMDKLTTEGAWEAEPAEDAAEDVAEGKAAITAVQQFLPFDPKIILNN